MSEKKHIAVVGEGAWGTAIASVLADAGHKVMLWCHDSENVSCIQNGRVNMRYMPEVHLSESIVPTASLQDALTGSAYVFEAIPVQYLRAVMKGAAPYVTPEQTWVVLSKGIENDTLCFPAQVVAEELPTTSIAVLNGPSYAAEVINRQLTAVIVASSDTQVASQVCSLVSTDYFIAHPSDALFGVQLCGAVKNVVALAVGIAQGAGLQENARAVVMTRGWNYMRHMLMHLDAEDCVAHSLAGIGDLVVTAMGSKSRNREVGVLLGQGKSLKSILFDTGYTPEGINTLKSLKQLCNLVELCNPFIDQLYRFVFSRDVVDARAVIMQLVRIPDDTEMIIE